MVKLRHYDKPKWKVTLSEREVAAILAGLRVLENAPDRVAVMDILTDGGMFPPLDSDELGDLAMRINAESSEPA